MGLDVIHVLSTERHYSEFKCVVCNCLTSLDSYVTSCCSHPICKSCLKCSEDFYSCPSCESALGKLDCLRTSQPLAHRVLSKLKVRCTYRKCKCRWTGDYKNLLSHIETNHRRKHRREMSCGNKHSSAIGSVENEVGKCNERKSPVLEVGEESLAEPLRRKVIASDTCEVRASSNDAAKKAISVMHDSNICNNILDDESNSNNSHETTRTTNGLSLTGLVVSAPDGPLLKASSANQLLLPPLPKKKSKDNVNMKERQFWDEKKQSSSKSLSSRHDDINNARSMLTRTRSDNTLPATDHGKAQHRRSRSSSLKKASSSYAHSRSPRRSRSMDRQNDLASALDESSSPLLKFNTSQKKMLQQHEKACSQLHKSLNSCTIEPSQNQDAENDEVTNDSLAQSLRAEAQLRTNQYEACIKSSLEAIRLHPSNVKAYLHKAYAETELGSFDAAIKTLALGLERIPSSREILQQHKVAKQTNQVMKTANCLMDAEMFEELIQVTEKVDVHNNFLLLMRAKAFLCLNLFDMAAETATEMYERDQESSDALVIRANAQYLNGHIENALVDCKTALTLNPNRESIQQLYTMFQNVGEWFSLAEQARQDKSYQKACSLCEMAIEAAEPQSLPKSSPLFRKLYLEKASALLHAGVYSEALDTVNMLLELHTSDIDGWNIKIDALEKMDRKTELLQELHSIVIVNKWGSEYAFMVEKYYQILHTTQELSKFEDTDVNSQINQVTLSNSDVDSFELVQNKLSSTAA